MIQASLQSTTSVPAVPRAEATSTHFFDDVSFRSVLRNGEPWFVANEACAALRIANPRDAIGRLAEDEKGVALTDTPGGLQSVNVISEGALYTLIIRSRDALEPGTVPYRFRRFVSDVVLPSIRRTGAYVPAAPTTGAALLEALKDPHAVLALVAHHAQGRLVAEQRAEAAEAKVEQQRPMVEAYEAFLDDRGMCNLRTAARAIDAPSQLFIDWLKDRKYVLRENGDLQPAAQMRRDGYMKLRAGPDAVGKLRNQAMVTRAGLEWLRQRWHVGPGRVLALQAAQAQRQGRLDV